MAFNFGAAALGFSRVLEDTKDRNLKKKLASQSFENDMKKILIKSKLDEGTKQASERRELKSLRGQVSQYFSDPEIISQLANTNDVNKLKNIIDMAKYSIKNDTKPDDMVQLLSSGGSDASNFTTQDLNVAKKLFQDEDSVSPTDKKIFDGYTPPSTSGYILKPFPKSTKEKYSGPLQLITNLTDRNVQLDPNSKEFKLNNQRIAKATPLLKKEVEEKGTTPAKLGRIFDNALKLSMPDSIKVGIDDRLTLSYEGNEQKVNMGYIKTLNNFLDSFIDIPKVKDDGFNMAYLKSLAKEADSKYENTVRLILQDRNANSILPMTNEAMLESNARTKSKGEPNVYRIADDIIIWDGNKILKNPLSLFTQ